FSLGGLLSSNAISFSLGGLLSSRRLFKSLLLEGLLFRGFLLLSLMFLALEKTEHGETVLNS
ncbi:hypothetical protein, partial [Cobetia crustatorum]|uniref:hypothetical protein n=1 Tax=Cobetia crustatorum TaxID=553385 RepID=UPI000553519B